MRFKIDWASLIVGRKFTVFALFYFVFEGNFQVQAPRGAYIWRGNLTEGFLRYEFGGLLFGVAYTWRGLFSEFYGILTFTLGREACVWIKEKKNHLDLSLSNEFFCFTLQTLEPSTNFNTSKLVFYYHLKEFTG